MPSSRALHVRPPEDGSGGDAVAAARLRSGIAQIQAELQVTPDFADEVEEAAAAAAASPRLPSRDLTDLQFVTIDPASSLDLDQALHVSRHGDGYLLRYAIADLAAFITPGDPVDLEAHRRGETLYGADAKIPLHPKRISEDAGSLLPDVDRPAVVWEIEVDHTGEGIGARVARAMVRSRAKLDYVGVQAQLDSGAADESLQLLRELGELRLARERAVGAVSLPLPDQEIAIHGDQWSLEYRSQLPVEQWNAQMSLLTGFAAGWLMTRARVGLVRTLPPAHEGDLQRLRRTAKALGLSWPTGVAAADFIRSLDPGTATDAAMIVSSTRLLRGSGYVAFDGQVPDDVEHAALAGIYAHVTAPLRRLADRYATEVCVAICADQPVPDWVRSELGGLPEVMRDSARRANQYENAMVNLVEAGLLRDRVGEEFTGVVVEVDHKEPHQGTLTIPDPAIEASVRGPGRLPLGEQVRARLVTADPELRRVEFELA